MKKSVEKRLAAVGLVAALAVSVMAIPGTADAAKAVKKVKLNQKKITLYAGAEANYGFVQLKATVKPKGAKVKLKWKSNKKKVASVNAKGLIKAKKPGKAVITVKAGKKSAKVKVIVKKIKKKVSKVTVNKSSVTLQKGQSMSIKANVAPKNATLKKVAFISSNPKTVSVSAKGVIKALQAGSATISVKAVDGSKKQAKVTVWVVDPSQGNVTQTPTGAPTQTPTGMPTEVPTQAPTGVPTQAPTQMPTGAPTQTPTEAPTQAPTGTPTEAPTQTPTEAPIATTDPKIQGNTKYTLDAASAYAAEVTVQKKKYEVAVNDATFAFASKVWTKAANGLTAYYKDAEAYKAKKLGSKENPVVYTLAAGITVSLYKNAGEEASYLTISGLGADIDGEYQMYLQQWYAGEWNRTYHVEMKRYGGDGSVINEIIATFDEMNTESGADGMKSTQYVIKGMSAKLGNSQKVYSDLENDNDDIQITASCHEKTDEGLLRVEKGNTVIQAASDGKDTYTVSIPDSYLEKYSIHIVRSE